MAGGWLVTGGILIVGLLVFGALLPRPNAEYAVSQLPFTIGSPGQQPSRHGQGQDAVQTREADRHEPTTDENGTPQSLTRDETSQATSEQAKRQRKSQSDDANRRQGQNEAPTGNSSEKPGDSRDKRTSSTDSTRRPHQSMENVPAKAKTSDKPAADANRPSVRPPVELVQDMAQDLMPLVKKIFYCALIVGGVYWLWRSRTQLLVALRDLLQSWYTLWQRLFGRTREGGPGGEAATSQPAQAQPPSFASFADPFATGMAQRWSPEELVKYSFNALEAWARQRGWTRQSEQTPHEFVERVGAEIPSLWRDVRVLADLYCRVAYAHGRLPPNSREVLKRLWEQLGAEAAASGRKVPQGDHPF
jgi:hypothetical protein